MYIFNFSSASELTAFMTLETNEGRELAKEVLRKQEEVDYASENCILCFILNFMCIFSFNSTSKLVVFMTLSYFSV
jgi:hypothetical protein